MHNASHRLKELRIVGGFLDGFVFDFSDKLNCIIGARGTGKTTLLEFIRYGLNSMSPDPRAQKRIDELVSSNLGGGRIEIKIETGEGVSYIISRAYGEPPRVLHDDATKSPAGIPFTRSLFSIDIFSQNEIEEIAGQSTYQMALLESFSKGELDGLKSSIEAVKKRLESNAAETFPLMQQIVNLQDEINLLPGVQTKMKQFAAAETGADADEINRAHMNKNMRTMEINFVNSLQNIYNRSYKNIEHMKDDFASQLNNGGIGDLQNSENAASIQTMYDDLLGVNAELNAVIDNFLERIKGIYGTFSAQKKALVQRHEQAEMEYRRIIEKCKEEQEKTVERRKVEDEYTRLMGLNATKNEMKRKIDVLEKERKDLIFELSTLRDRRFAARAAIVDRINSALMPHIRVTLEQYGSKDEYCALLTKWLAKSGIMYRQVSHTISEFVNPPKLARILRDSDPAKLIEATGLNQNQAKVVMTQLRTKNFLAELEIVEMEDKTKIELDDQGIYKPTETLSTGQKCDTILPILLLESERPLLIDQPEDNLDNRFVHNTIVANVLHVKENRQLIFVTHNPNIPVLSDAERMLVMTSDGKSAKRRKCGTVDECKEDIIDLLEGGADAFRKRKERYAC